MKKTLTLTASLAALGFAQSAIAGEVIAPVAPAPAAACDAGLTGDISLGYVSQYSFRGINELISPHGDDSFHAGINVEYALNDQWSLVAGTTFQTVDNNDGYEFDHNRYHGGVRYNASSYTVEVGYQGHNGMLGAVLGNVEENTEEIYVNVGTTCPLTGGALNLFVAHDLDQRDGTYVELSLGKGFELTECVGLDLTVGVSYSFDYWDNWLGTGSDFNHAYITAEFPIELSDTLTVTPHVTYSQGLDALDLGYGIEEEDEVTFGVKASVSF